MVMPGLDLHQHLWPEALLAALARRYEAPRLRRRGDRWELELTGEAPSELVLADHDPVTRALQAERDGVDVVAIAPSGPLGIEWLPYDEAQPLLDAYHAGILELGDPFRLWAAPSLAAPAAGAEEIDALLDRGALGACVPATALAGEAGRERLSALLGRLQARDAALFVHPGPARAATDLGPCVVAGPDLLRGRHAGRVAGLDCLGPPRPPAPARAVRDARRRARRCRPSGSPPAAARPTRSTTSSPTSTSPPTAPRPSTRCCASSAWTGSCTAPTARWPSRRELGALGPSFAHAITEANPARLLSLDPVPA